MAGYDPKGKRARSAKPAGDSTVPIDAMLNATGEHAVTNVDPTPTPPDGVSLVDFEAATLPPEASREGKRNTEDTEAVVVDPVDVEPIDQAAADDPEDPTPPEAPSPSRTFFPPSMTSPSRTVCPALRSGANRSCPPPHRRTRTIVGC